MLRKRLLCKEIQSQHPKATQHETNEAQGA
jgi:hypothetical protein